VEVTRGDITDLVTALGTLQPLRYVDIGAQVSGQLQRLHVRIGDRVKAGDLLGEIDARVIQSRHAGNTAELERLRGVLAQQEAQRDLASAQARRQQTMFAANATSRDALDTALAQVRVLEAQIAQTRSQIQGQESVLATDRTNLSFTRIVAPMDGTVVSITAVEGQTLNANYSAPLILRVADLSTMTVMAQVSEADQPKLSLGMPVRFNTLGRPDRHYEAVLRQIYPTPEVVNNVVLYSALFDVPNPDGALLPQMTAQVFFVRAEAKDATLVPVAALSPARRDAARRTVRVLDGAGVPRPREVTIGVSDRVNAEVKAGLEPGERVVISAAGASPDAGRRPAGRTPRL
jgi:macrolide-specific efflux system membrane fusion protein